jgi:hypothetical protein
MAAFSPKAIFGAKERPYAAFFSQKISNSMIYNIARGFAICHNFNRAPVAQLVQLRFLSKGMTISFMMK